MTNRAEKYIPENLRPQPIFQNVAELLEVLFLQNDPELALLFAKHDLFSGDTDVDLIHATIADSGYSYITDMLPLNVSELQDLLAYLPLIHYLKGSRAGVELLFRLLGINFTLAEWWEPQEDPNSTVRVIASNNATQIVYDGAVITLVDGDIIKCTLAGTSMFFEVSASVSNVVNIRIPAITNVFLNNGQFYVIPEANEFATGSLRKCVIGEVFSATTTASLHDFSDDFEGVQKLGKFLTSYVYPKCTVIAVEIVVIEAGESFIGIATRVEEVITMQSQNYAF